MMMSLNACKKMPEVLQTELDLSSAISNLEDRVAVLETDFSQMLTTASKLLQATTQYIDKQETEKQFLLSQMKLKSADLLDVNMLWHLHDNQDVQPAYLAAVKHFGFDTKDIPNLKLLLGLTYILHIDMENKNSANRKIPQHEENENIFRDGVESLVDDEIKLHLKELVKLMGVTVHGDQQNADEADADTDVNENEDAIHDKAGNTSSIVDKSMVRHTNNTQLGDTVEITENSHYIEKNNKGQSSDDQGKKEKENIENGYKCQPNDKCRKNDKEFNESSQKSKSNNTHGKKDKESNECDKDLQVTNKNDESADDPRACALQATKDRPGLISSGASTQQQSQLVDKKRLWQIIGGWGVDKGMQETIRKIVYTVLWHLNIGRQEKNLKIT